MITFAFISLLIILGAIIVRQDIASLTIDAIYIYAFWAISLVTVMLDPLPGLGITAHIVGGAIGAALAVSARLYFLKVRNIDGLGEADVWLISAAGFLVGPFLFGPWMFLAALLAAILMVTSQRLSGKRIDPDSDHTVAVMPLTPTLVISSLIMSTILRAELIASNQLPI